MPVFGICPMCGTEFERKTYRHVYCKRKCFLGDYYTKLKQSDYPSFLCPKCKTRTKLDFHPRKSRSKWEDYQCPSCGYKNTDQ